MRGHNAAVYFPEVDITDEGWLKTQVLYWDEIVTIIPRHHVITRHLTPTLTRLRAENVLTDWPVSSVDEEVERASARTDAYLESSEGARLLEAAARNGRASSEGYKRLFSDKVSHDFDEKLQRRLGKSRYPHLVRMPNTMVDCHVGILAEEIASEFHGTAISTKETLSRLTASAPWVKLHASNTIAPMPSLIDLTLQGIAVPASASVDRVLDFRDDHQRELLRLRQHLEEAADLLRTNPERYRDFDHIYRDEVESRLLSLKRSGWDRLRATVRTIFDQRVVGVGGILAASGNIPFALLGMVGTAAVVSTLDAYHEERTSEVAYLVAAGRHLK